MSIRERLFTGQMSERFPTGLDRNLDVFLKKLQRKAPRKQGVFESARILFARSYDIYPYNMTPEIQEARKSDPKEFTARMLKSLWSQIDRLGKRKFQREGRKETLSHFRAKSVQLASNVTIAGGLRHQKELREILAPETGGLVPQLNEIERGVLQDLAMGIGHGDSASSLLAIDRLTGQANRYFTKERIPKKNNDLGNDFISFLFVANLDEVPFGSQEALGNQS